VFAGWVRCTAIFALPNAAAFVAPAVLTFVAAHPEMHRWLPDADAQRLSAAGPTLEALAKAMKPRATKPKPSV